MVELHSYLEAGSRSRSNQIFLCQSDCLPKATSVFFQRTISSCSCQVPFFQRLRGVEQDLDVGPKGYEVSLGRNFTAFRRIGGVKKPLVYWPVCAGIRTMTSICMLANSTLGGNEAKCSHIDRSFVIMLNSRCVFPSSLPPSGVFKLLYLS